MFNTTKSIIDVGYSEPVLMGDLEVLKKIGIKVNVRGDNMKKPYPVTDKVIESRQRTARLYNTKKVKMYDLHTGEYIDTYDSIREAEIDNDLCVGSIGQAFCRGNGELKKAGLKFIRIERGSE